MPLRRTRSPRSLLPVGLLVVSGVMLVLTTALGLALHSTIGELRIASQEQQALAGTNVRTLSQVQREMLRLQAELADPGPDDQSRLLLAFVDQRVRESTLALQTAALGEQNLLRSRLLAREWTDQVRPVVVRAVAAPDDRTVAAAAVSALVELERDYSSLVSDAENERKRDAAAARTRFLALAARLGHTTAVLVGMTAAFLVVLLSTAAAYVHLTRQRTRVSQALVERDGELRVLSEVARRTENSVVITDPQARVEWVNTAFVTATGWSLQESVGLTLAQLVLPDGPDGADGEELATALARGRSFAGETSYEHRSGSRSRVALDVQPIRDADGTVEHFIVVGTDVTTRAETERNLRAAKETAEAAVREKSAFLATMSHELRTPLNGVLGAVELLGSTALDPEQRQLLRLIGGTGDAMRALVDNLLTFSALEAGGRHIGHHVVDVHELVHDCGAASRPDPEPDAVTFHCTVDPRTPRHVFVDGFWLRQLLRNLLDNAWKFTTEGTIRLTLGPAAEEGVFVLEVADTGCGIAPDRLDGLFVAFDAVRDRERVAGSGAGMGLPTCATIARHLGGRIEVDSEPGRGSTFRVVLPLPVPAETPQTTGAVPGTVHQPADLAVLVVEDNSVNRVVVCRMLHRLGFDPDEAVDGLDALARLRRRPYDLLLVDIDMPRMNGLALADAIRSGHATSADPVLVALTANALPGDRQRFLSAGMDGYLPKPVRTTDLARELRDCLRRRGDDLALDDAPDPSAARPPRPREHPDAPGGPAEPTAPVDLPLLSSQLGDPGEDLLHELVTLFVTDSRGRLPLLVAGHRAGDAAEVSSLAHTLKGASANIRAERVRQLAEEIENAARAGTLVPADRLAALESALDEVAAWIPTAFGAARTGP